MNVPDRSASQASLGENPPDYVTRRRILIAGSRTDRAALALAKKLSARGHAVVLLLWGPPTGKREDPDHNLGTLVWPSKRPTHLQDALFLVRVIARIRPTHVIGNFGSVNLMMVIGYCLRVPNRISWYQTLTAQIDMDSNQPLWKGRFLIFRKRLVYQAATDIVTNSEAGKRDVMEVFSVPAKKVTVFPNSIADPLLTASQPLATVESGTILCVGRLRPSKGQDVLIHALSQLRKNHPKAHVVFVGSGPCREEYCSLAARLGVLDRCRFLGGQPHTEVLRLMAAASVCVVPSRSEAFGYVNIESMAVGTPVVASDVGGISEIIRDGTDGFLVPPGDVDALTDRISRVLSDPSLRSELGQNARLRFLEKYEQRAAVTAQAEWIEAMVHTGPPLIAI